MSSASYIIHTVDDPGLISGAPLTELEHFSGGAGSYRPRTTARTVYVRQRGFLTRMECFELSPKADETRLDGDVYKDSCMEWFVNFAPERDSLYLNLEGNAQGVMDCKFGRDRYLRRPLSGYGAPRPKITAELLPDRWRIDYFIPLETVCVLFGKAAFSAGDVITGNFYKCGDETSQPHFGMWSPVELEKLDFHRPDFFGSFEIV